MHTLNKTEIGTIAGWRASLHISNWEGRKHDKDAQAHIAEHYGNDEKVARVYKDLIDEATRSLISVPASRARAIHIKYTVPWDDDRCLPAQLYMKYRDEMNVAKDAFYTGKAKLLAAYPAAIEAFMKSKLGGLAKESDYLSVDVLAKRIHMRVLLRPLPEAEDFLKMRIPDEDKEKQVREYEAQQNESKSEATLDCARRMVKVLSNSIESLSKYNRDEDGNRTGTFRDSAVNNIKDVLDLVQQLNFWGDKDLDQMVDEARQRLCVYPAQALRESDEVREHVILSAEDVLNKMNKFFA